MNDPIVLRKLIREALAMRPRYEFTERQHFEVVRRKCIGEHLDLEEFLQAREWNHERNLIEFRRNDDLDEDVWQLTTAGKAQEGVK